MYSFLYAFCLMGFPLFDSFRLPSVPFHVANQMTYILYSLSSSGFVYTKKNYFKKRDCLKGKK